MQGLDSLSHAWQTDNARWTLYRLVRLLSSLRHDISPDQLQLRFTWTCLPAPPDNPLTEMDYKSIGGEGNRWWLRYHECSCSTDSITVHKRQPGERAGPGMPLAVGSCGCGGPVPCDCRLSCSTARVEGPLWQHGDCKPSYCLHAFSQSYRLHPAPRACSKPKMYAHLTGEGFTIQKPKLGSQNNRGENTHQGQTLSSES